SGQLPGPPLPGTIPPRADLDQTFQYYRALWERQKFASDIFDRLVQATGAVAVDAAGEPFAVGAPQHQSPRYLAQLAVNIVDYVDDDEFSTTFFWDQYHPAEVVNGVESPRLVMNELYGEIRNDPADTGQFANNPFKVHFWVEMFNPRTKA